MSVSISQMNVEMNLLIDTKQANVIQGNKAVMFRVFY